MNIQNENGQMLLFSSNEWYKELSHDEIQKVISQAKAWLDRLNAQGKIKGGQALARKGAIVSGKNGRLVSDGPFAESKEAIGGYLLLDVTTMDEALAIAKQCPGLPYGIRVEVRPVAGECPIGAEARTEAQFAQV